jgi:hypothetical protein
LPDNHPDLLPFITDPIGQPKAAISVIDSPTRKCGKMVNYATFFGNYDLSGRLKTTPVKSPPSENRDLVIAGRIWSPGPFIQAAGRCPLTSAKISLSYESDTPVEIIHIHPCKPEHPRSVPGF